VPPAFLTQRDAFAHDLAVRPMKWSRHDVARLLRLTGARPDRVTEPWALLAALGMGDHRWACTGGVFDYCELWGSFGQPRLIVGHRDGVGGRGRALLAEPARFGTLRVSVDDRPGYYGHGTDHIRISLVEPMRPYGAFPSTRKTRAARRAVAEASPS
jgi:hypothetical protein